MLDEYEFKQSAIGVRYDLIDFSMLAELNPQYISHPLDTTAAVVVALSDYCNGGGRGHVIAAWQLMSDLYPSSDPLLSKLGKGWADEAKVTISYLKDTKEPSLGLSDLVNPLQISVLAKVLHEGALKYGDDAWQNIPPHHHANHAIAHLIKFSEGDETESHVDHALARIYFILALT